MTEDELKVVVDKQRQWITKIMKENRELKLQVRELSKLCNELSDEVKTLECIQFVNDHARRAKRGDT